MTVQGFEIRPFNLRSATDQEYGCLNRFKNILRHEVLPDDPPVPCQEEVEQWRTLPDFLKEASWAAWDEAENRIIAHGEVLVFYTGQNEHMADFNIQVLAEHRRQGLGRQMLRQIVEFVHSHQRRLMISSSNDRVPASAAFLARLGAQQGLVLPIYQLRLAELDRPLIDRWLERSHNLLPTFDIGLWDGPYPDDQIAAIAHLIETLGKDVPRDDLEVEDWHFTPEIVRQIEHSLFSSGTKRWTVYVMHRSDRQLAGLTEVLWNPNRPTILNQELTGVLPAYRHQGVGRWLKADMITRIRRDHPEVEVIRTGNANSNAPMLKINLEMGFKPFMARAIWQVDTDTVDRYLSATT